MTNKHANKPPRNRSLLQQFRVPIVVFGGVIVLALVVLKFGDKLQSKDSKYITGGAQISAAMLEKFAAEYDEAGVSQGPQDAKLVVREFADYQCPACGAFEPTAQRIREDFAASGKLRFIFFDFPLNMHQNARAAAVAARCADGEAFWPYHEKLFATQRQWAGEADPTNSFLDLAVESGVPFDSFRQCLKQGGTEEIVTKSGEIARQVGVSSTPTVIIGRQVFTGVQGYDTLKAEIESQLATPAQ